MKPAAIFSRELQLFAAKVYLREAKIRKAKGQTNMAATLLRWALNARRRAAAIKPEQGDLFGSGR